MSNPLSDKTFARLLMRIEQPDAIQYLNLAFESFFGEIMEETGLTDIDDIQDLLGEENWDRVSLCALEFFFSNDYRDGYDAHKRWNFIDLFLKEEGDSITAQEKHYLEGLRDSHMSLYRVTQNSMDGNLVLYDMVEDIEGVTAQIPPDVVSDIEVGDVFGLRLIADDGNKLVSPGGLPIQNIDVDEFAGYLKSMLAAALKLGTKVVRVDVVDGKATFTPERIEHLTRVMLAKEIAAEVMFDMIEDSSPVAEALEGALDRMLGMMNAANNAAAKTKSCKAKPRKKNSAKRSTGKSHKKSKT